MMTGCVSSTKVSPAVNSDTCKIVATQAISPPPDYTLLPLSTPIQYPSGDISKLDIINNQSQNNALWQEDRTKLSSLQAYVKKLQESGQISR